MLCMKRKGLSIYDTKILLQYIKPTVGVHNRTSLGFHAPHGEMTFGIFQLQNFVLPFDYVSETIVLDYVSFC